MNVSRTTRSIGSPADLATWAAPAPANADSRCAGSIGAALSDRLREPVPVARVRGRLWRIDRAPAVLVRAHLWGGARAPAALIRAALWRTDPAAPAALVEASPLGAADHRRPAALVRAGLLAAVAMAIVTAMPAAHAQGAPAAGQSAAAPPSTPGSSASQAPASAPPSTGANSSTAPSSPATSATGQAPPAGQATASKSDPVCFKLTGRCVDNSKPATKAATAGSAKAGSSSKQPLNLTAPDVRTVVPESELKEPLPSTDQVTETQEADTVQVKTDEGVPPDVPLGFGAIWWAVNHPSQAWRIVTPAE
jgi:hypothetical protein